MRGVVSQCSGCYTFSSVAKLEQTIIVRGVLGMPNYITLFQGCKKKLKSTVIIFKDPLLTMILCGAKGDFRVICKSFLA